MDYSELLFAERIHKIATKRFDADLNDACDRMEASGIDSSEQIDAWEKANPFEKYVKEAYHDVVETAAQIRVLREQ